MKRRILRLGVVVAVGGLMTLGTPPSQAVGPFGAGQVIGTLTLSPGTRLIPPLNDPLACEPGGTFVFNGVLLNGVITDGAQHSAGSISVDPVHGGTDCPADGGHIDLTFFNGPNISGSFSGRYDTYGPHVQVWLVANMTIGGTSYSNVPINLDLTEAIPTAVSPGDPPRATSAQYVGEYHVGVGA